jgi:hypothetical protein
LTSQDVIDLFAETEQLLGLRRTAPQPSTTFGAPQ